MAELIRYACCDDELEPDADGELLILADVRDRLRVIRDKEPAYSTNRIILALEDLIEELQ